MRFLAPTLLLALLAAPLAASADPADPEQRRALLAEEADRLRFGITGNWWTERLGRQLGLGVGWTLPQRWYDADGELLTERSLLNPGDDLERTGVYFALRF